MPWAMPWTLMAAKNPHLATGGEGGLEKNDLAQIAAVVGESHTYMHMDEELKKRGINGNQRFIESMGKGKASEADKETYFDVFEKEFEKMKAPSIRLSTAVFGNNRDQLLNLRSSYFDLVEKLESKRDELKKERNKKGSKSNPALIVSIEASIKDLEAAKIKMLSDIPVRMSQWIAAIDTKINNELKKNGVDKLRPPSEISLELKAIEAEVKKARKEHVQAAII